MPKNTKPLQAGHRERLRKKFLSAGLDSFLEHEVLELLLTYTLPRKDTKPLAWALLKKFGSLANVLDASMEELNSIDGIGTHSALFLKIIRASFKKYMQAEVKGRQLLNNPQLVMDYCLASLAGKKEESLEVIFLSSRRTVLSTQHLASGTLDQVSISPRQVVSSALQANASFLILVHNHPSGEISPSPADIQLTQKIVQAARLFDIEVQDHIVVGKGKCFSFKFNHLL